MRRAAAAEMLLIALALMNIFPQMITLLPNLMKGTG